MRSRTAGLATEVNVATQLITSAHVAQLQAGSAHVWRTRDDRNHVTVHGWTILCSLHHTSRMIMIGLTDTPCVLKVARLGSLVERASVGEANTHACAFYPRSGKRRPLFIFASLAPVATLSSQPFLARPSRIICTSPIDMSLCTGRCDRL